jgi:hypothetical protein
VAGYTRPSDGIGHPKEVARYQERLGEPVEAVCSVAPDVSFAKRFLEALTTHRSSQIWTLVLTSSKLYLFVPRWRAPATELLCVPYSDIADMWLDSTIALDPHFRLSMADGPQLQLRALRVRHYGRDTVDRLAQLIDSPGPETTGTGG